MRTAGLLALALAACCPTTPHWGIPVDAEGLSANMSQVDEAWTLARGLAGYQGSLLPVVTLQATLVTITGVTQQYSGLTVDAMSRVYVPQPCLLGADVALVHELVHAALWLRSGDGDAGHTGPEWVGADGAFGECVSH